MAEPTVVAEHTAPFECASELREAHARLLEALDSRLGHDASAQGEEAALVLLGPEIREFVERAALTGVYLEDVVERTACQTLVDYWVSSLSHVGTLLGSVRLARFDGEQLPDLKDKPCPYVGLEAFREPTFFYGREADIEAILTRLRDTPLVVVVGASGSGKSSLVLGGVLPAIEAGRLATRLSIIPPFVPGNTLFEHLADAVLVSRGSKDGDIAAEAVILQEDPQHLRGMLGGEQAPSTLITIDQFEEVFTLSASADREALAASLGALLGAGQGHRLILTVREEFRSRIVELPTLSPFLDNAWYSMRPMGYEALRAVIEEPAKKQNLQFQPGIIDDLVKKVLGQPAALPLLQFTLRSLWDARDRNRITWEVYRKVGDPLNALNTSCERFYIGLLTEDQSEAKRILLELVRVDELLEAYRQPVAKSHLLQAGSANTEKVLRLLADNEYVRITPGLSGADPVVEVKHESLVRNWPRLVEWIHEKRTQIRERLALNQAAQRWTDSGKPEEGLLTGWQLQAAEGEPDLSDLEKEFVQASSEAIDRERAALRRRAKLFRSLAATASVLAVISIAAGMIAFRQYTRTLQQYTQIKNQSNQIKQQFTEIQNQNNQITQQYNEIKQKDAKIQKLDELLRALHSPNTRRDIRLLLSIEALQLAPDHPEFLGSLMEALTTNLEVGGILTGHRGTVRAVRFSPDRKVLASASGEGIILLRHPVTGRMLHPPLKGHQDWIWDLAFSGDGKMLASAANDGVRLWNVETGGFIGALPHDGKSFGVAIRNDGKILASAGENGRVTIYDLDQKKILGVLVPGEQQTGKSPGNVYRVAFSPDGATLASGGEDKRIFFWNVLTHKQIGKPLMVGSEVFSLAFNHSGKKIVFGDRIGEAALWDMAKHSKLQQMPLDHEGPVFGVAFSPDDRQLATVSSDKSVHIYNLDDPSAKPQKLTGESGLFGVDFAADGRVASGTDDGMVTFWDPDRPIPFGSQVQSRTGEAAQAFYTADGKTLVSCSNDKVQFWPVENMTASPPAIPSDRRASITICVPAPDGENLVVVHSDNSIELWDLTKRRSAGLVLQPGKRSIVAAAYSHDSRTLAAAVVGSDDQGEVWLFNMPAGSRRQVLGPWEDNRIGALAFSPKENILAIANADSTISVWNTDTSEHSTFRLSPAKSYDRENVISLAFSPGDGRYLASGGDNGVLRLWDMGSHSESPLTLKAHRGSVRSVAFSLDGKLLASGGSDKTVLLWDVATGIQLSPPLEGHGSAIKSLAFRPDGRSLASTANNGTIISWEIVTPALLSRACQIVGRNFTPLEWNRFFGNESFRVTCPIAAANEADARALEGDQTDAKQLFEQARDAALLSTEAQDANEVCWLGSLDGFATIVKLACDRAVELASESQKADFTDSRGLARALTGDRDGAIKDFETEVKSVRAQPDLGGNSEDVVRRREDWIAALKEGRDPFDKQLLNALRGEY